MFFPNCDSSKTIAKCSFIIRSLCNFSKTTSFIKPIPWSVNFDCLNTSGSVNAVSVTIVHV